MRILVTATALALATLPLHAQDDAPAEAKSRALRGTMVAFDASTRELTVALGGDNPRYETYVLPADLVPAIGGREGTFADLNGRRPVTLRVAADGETVAALEVHGDSPRREGGEEARRERPKREGGEEARRDRPRREGEGHREGGEEARRDRPRREGEGERRREAAPRGHLFLREVDRDRDGRISREEFEAAFAGLDKDGDGMLTASELRGGARDGDGEGEGGRKARRERDDDKDEEREDAGRERAPERDEDE